uniref:PABPN1 like, cytoplasmic n=1 Tax=Serinus canaria TaxID=9135 RepID=A0A8C9UC11_SERCA
MSPLHPSAGNALPASAWRRLCFSWYVKWLLVQCPFAPCPAQSSLPGHFRDLVAGPTVPASGGGALGRGRGGSRVQGEQRGGAGCSGPGECLPGWGTGFPWCPKEMGSFYTWGVPAPSELEAIKAKLREIEKEDERLKELQLEAENHLFVSSEAGMALFPLTTKEKMEADQRSIYVGNVDYGGTAEELESHFNSCGQINRVTILCDKFSGHPKGYAYIEFEEQSSVKAAVELDESVFRGRVIKVLPKRTNMPGISSTDRGGYRGCFHARGGLGRWGGPYGQQPRMRGRTYRGRARLLPWYFPY